VSAAEHVAAAVVALLLVAGFYCACVIVSGSPPSARAWAKFAAVGWVSCIALLAISRGVRLFWELKGGAV
jgi:hypothetical protein